MTPFSIPRRWRKGSFHRPGICRFGFDCRDPDRKSHCGSETAVSCCHIFSKPLLTFNIVDGDPIVKPCLNEVEPWMTVLRLLFFSKAAVVGATRRKSLDNLFKEEIATEGRLQDRVGVGKFCGKMPMASWTGEVDRVVSIQPFGLSRD